MSTANDRAATAAHSILRTFSTKIAGVPGTLLGAVVVPDFRSRKLRFTHWHYWWQAHLIDAVVDAGLRTQRTGDDDAARAHLERALTILRSVSLRNFGSLVNRYYDDMAWMTLAAERINDLSLLVTGEGSVAAQDAGARLYSQLESAVDSRQGGAYWSKARDFKNTPANAPIALAFVRAHRYRQAADLLNWLHANLWDAGQRVYNDGISYKKGQKPRLEEGRYSYNAGPVLAALLEFPADQLHLLTFDRGTHISDIVSGVFDHFTRSFTDADGATRLVLASGGDGDGGLFPGILTRYLVLAAQSPLVSADQQKQVRKLILETAAVTWEGRREFDPDLPMSTPGIDPTSILGEPVALFSPDVTRHVSDVLKPGAPAELSNQLTSWMLLEAAAVLSS